MRLTLFVSRSGPSLRALATVQHVVRRLGERVSVDVCDVSRDPDRAERAGVVFTPVLRLERAGLDPVTIFGALDDHERLLRRLVQAGLPLDADGSAPRPAEASTVRIRRRGPDQRRRAHSGYGLIGVPSHQCLVGRSLKIVKCRWGVSGGALPLVPTYPRRSPFLTAWPSWRPSA